MYADDLETITYESNICIQVFFYVFPDFYRVFH